jgi:hypothetical protein
MEGRRMKNSIRFATKDHIDPKEIIDFHTT